MLIVAGEVVFLLPFVLSRIFRPTFLSVFNITNLELGTAFSLYGVVAMISYFAGGPLADRYSARRLMSIALVMTSLGGISLAFIPSLTWLILLYSFWGLTTILLFWAALIRATREWGDTGKQGRAFGLLDGGRGLFAAMLASLSVWVFSLALPLDAGLASEEELKAGLQSIIVFYAITTFLVSALVWFLIPDMGAGMKRDSGESVSLEGVRFVVRKPVIWLQAIIVICAYVGYKCTDDISLYASDAFGYDDVEAASLGTLTFWVRPFAAVVAGILGDYFKNSIMVVVSFVMLIVGSLVISLGLIPPDIPIYLTLVVAGTSLGIYALRGLYFALFQEANIPPLFTGSAVGVVSFLGFTPDIFMGPLMGFLLDRSPGALGHQHLFGVLALFGVIGVFSALIFYRITSKNQLGV